MRDDNLSPRSRGLESAAKSDFEHARHKAFWRSLTTWFTKDRNALIPFDEVRRRLPRRGQHYIGLRQIPLNQVVGSVGRYNDFDAAFLPRQVQTRGRWISIDRAHLQDVILPPIEVYKIGQRYFVKDGNHRVSVARERGQFFIDAYVIEIDLSIEADETTDIDELIIRQEQAEFLDQTRLLELRPDANIVLTLPGQYEKLEEHISVHRWFMGEARLQEVTPEEAIVDWYDTVYLPLVQTIRELGVLKEFPERTEADLYLWIIEHLWYLRGDTEGDVTLRDAAEHFAETFSTRPVRKLLNTFRRLSRSLSFGSESGSQPAAGEGSTGSGSEF